MEKETLPNSTLIMILGILAVVLCCCYGVPGLISGIVALVLANQAKRTYIADPELYKGYNNVKTGKILSIIGISLSVIYVIILIVTLIAYGGIDGIMEAQEELMRNVQ